MSEFRPFGCDRVHPALCQPRSKSDEQTDCQRESEPGDERIHGCRPQAATVGRRSRTHLTICPAVIAPDVRAISLPP